MHPLVAPLTAMLVLTALVWLTLYWRRLGYMRQHHIAPDDLRMPKGRELLSDWAQLPANNLTNLFELPVAFYTICLTYIASGWIDPSITLLAWVFVGFRALHSLIHCTVNKVVLRFSAYALASLALWAMLGLLVWRVVAEGAF